MGAAKSKRNPGFLTSLMGEVSPKSDKELLNLAEAQDRINEMFFRALDNSLPARHAASHKGGGDSVAGTGDPLPVTLTGEADRGDPEVGYSPHNHVHTLEGTAGDTLDSLDGIDTETINGLEVAYVFNPRAHELLEDILLEVMKLNGEV